MGVSLQQIAKWKSQQNPLEKVLGGGSICPTLLARGQEDSATMLLISEELKETTNLRSVYMENIKCEQVAQIDGQGFTEMTGRVYAESGLSPCIRTCGGGNTEPKIMAYDEQNRNIRQDGTVGTLTTDGSSPKHNNRVIDLTDHTKVRVRKLTEHECGKLMGVKHEDILQIGKNLSKSAQYHCFGDSIVCTVLMAIFGQMFDIDWKEKTNETIEEIIRK